MATTKEIIEQFESAFQTHDPNSLEAIIAEDCVLENTGPAPEGAKYQGKAACLAFWTSIVTNKDLHFDEENIDIIEDRGIITWRLYWGKSAAESVRGVNIMRVRGGKIIEALGYVKS